MGEVNRGKHAYHAGLLASGVDICPGNSGVTVRAAQDGHVQDSRGANVIDITALATREPTIFDTLEWLANESLDHWLRFPERFG